MSEEKKEGGEEAPKKYFPLLLIIYSEVGQMKRGDYMIHVFIEKAKQIKVASGETVDPMVEVGLMGQKKFTSAKDKIGGTSVIDWNEHLFFEPKNVEQDEIEQAKISLRLMDKGFFKDAVIGAYEFDIAFIYFMKNHTLLHTWLALSNPESENFNEIAAYLKVSITIAATGDEQIQLQEDDNMSGEDNVMMPTSIKPEFYQVKFKFFRAEKLPALDMSFTGGKGKLDAYITSTYLKKKLKTDTKIQKEGESVDWDQEFLIPCQIPIMSSRVVMKLFDEDNVCDEIVGSFLFNLKESINNKNGQFFWKNIYGAPLKCSGDNTNRMNEIPEAASTWKGRVLMQIEAFKTEKPLLICQSVSEEAKLLAMPHLMNKEYDVIIEIGQGISLPTAGEKYSIMVKIGEIEFKSEKASQVEGTYNRWNQRIKQQTISLPYIDVHDMGKVFIYLMSGSSPVCYYAAEAHQFQNPDAEMKWYELKCDLAIGKVKDAHKAGLVSLKMSIHDRSKNGPIEFEKQIQSWKKPPPRRLNVYKIRVYLFQCRDLPAADDDGQSDPYLVLWDQSKVPQRTPTIEDNLNPLFYKPFELQVEAYSIETLPPFIIDVYDYDLMGDDFISRCVIPLKEANYALDDGTMKQTVPRPKWHGCKLTPTSPVQGEILCSFSVVSDDFRYDIGLNYLKLKEYVDFQEFTVSLNILGLRDLQSVGILPVKKPFIVFNLKSMVPPDEGSNLENLKTQPSAAGCNPTLNTLLEFKAELPADPLYCPRLSCQVHDYIFKGFNQPLLGSFIIPVGDLIFALKKEREEETGQIEFINNELDKILRDEGAVSYVFRDSEKDKQEELDRSDIIQKQKSITSELKKSIKLPDQETAQPLLLEYQVFDDEPGTKRSGGSRKSHHSNRESEMQEIKKQGSVKSGEGKIVQEERRSQIGGKPASSKSKMSRGTNAMKLSKKEKFNPAEKQEMIKKKQEEDEKRKRQQEEERQREMEELKRSGSGKQMAKNLLMPTYYLDERLNVYREDPSPPPTMYLPLGWDETPDMERKHYRRFYTDELENITEVMPTPTPFTTYNLKRGQSRGNKSSFFSFGAKKTDESGAISTEQIVGRFKGIVTVQSEKDKAEYAERKGLLINQLTHKLSALSQKVTGKPIEINLEKLDSHEGRQKFDLMIEPLGIQHLQITKHLGNLESDETLKRLLLAETKCMVRLYMISAFSLSSRDNGGASDPYLKINLGSKTYNERDNYQLDEPNPVFYKMYEFEAKFPGCPPLVIDCLDYDDIFGDDSIGVTSIDLEDRFFSVEWQSIKDKPCEERQIYHPSSSVSQGVLKLWVEIHPTMIPPPPPFDITPKPDEIFEVRFVVFDTLDVVAMDVEGTSDVFCRAFFDQKLEVHDTDTHFRCSNGKASFNYRLVYHITISDTKKNNYVLTLQAFDRDFFKSNDIIGEVQMDLKQAIEDCRLSGRPLGINKKYYNDYMKDKVDFKYKDDSSFFVDIMGNNDKGERVCTGKIRCQIDILPQASADANKVGEARQEPNHSPFLPPPVGRISFSLNPLKMFSQMVGPAMRRKIYCYCCCAICIMLCVMLFPLILGNLLSSMVSSFFGF